MKKLSERILLIINGILLLAFAASFFIRPGKDLRKPVKTALLNNKYLNEVTVLELGNDDEMICLYKKSEGKWLIQNPYNPEEFVCADTERVEKLLNNLIKVRKLYKISDKNKEKITNHIIYYYKNSDGALASTDLRFGPYDFSRTSRYFSTDINTSLYEIDTELDPYLSPNVQNWANPYIYPDCRNYKASDIQRVIAVSKDKTSVASHSSKNWEDYSSRLLELRHGGYCINKSKELLYTITIEYGDTNQSVLEIYATENDEEYNVKYKDYSYKISPWTLSKLVYSE